MKLLIDTIKPATFTADELTGRRAEYFSSEINCTVSIDLGRSVIEDVKACRTNNVIWVFGFTGSYKTSAKQWKAALSFDETGEVRLCYSGRDDRSGLFQKLKGLSYNPESYFA